MSSILGNTSGILRSAAGILGVSQSDANLRRFITNSLGAGYGADAILQFVQSLKDPVERGREQREEGRVASGVARPEEAARVSERSRRDVSKFIPIAAALAGAGIASAGGQRGPEVEIMPRGSGGGQALKQIGEVGQQPQPSPSQGSQVIPSGATIEVGENVQEAIDSGLTYFDRAIEGIQYFKPVSGLQEKLQSSKRNLDRLEKKKIPFESPQVQKFVSALRALSGEGEQTPIRETNQNISQQPQQATQQAQGDAEFQQILDMMNRYLS